MKRVNIILILFSTVMLFISACTVHSVDSTTDMNTMAQNLDNDSCILLESKVLPTLPQRTYSEIEYAHSEDPGTNGFVRKMDTTIKDGTTFYFEQSIDTNIREACITQTIAFLTLLGETEYKIYIFEPETMVDGEIRPRAIYTHVQNFESPDYLAQILLAQYGNYCLYGLTYGYACYLLGIPAADTVKYIGDNPSLDLNLLCFIDRFTEPEEINNCKEIAKELVRWLIEQHGEERFKTILQNSGQLEYLEKTIELLKEFYQINGVEFEPLPAMVRLGGYSFDYALSTKYGFFFVDRRYEDIGLSLRDSPIHPLLYEGFFHKRYTDIRKYFIISIKEIDNLSFLFPETDMSDTKVFYDNIGGGTAQGHEIGGITKANCTIHLKGVYGLIHEMSHIFQIRTLPYTARERWYTEGLAEYYSMALDNTYYSAWNDVIMEYNMRDKSNSLGFLCQQYLEIKGNTSFSTKRDLDFIDAIAVFYDQNLDSSYQSNMSFFGYILKEYGEESLKKFLYADSFENSYDYGVFGGKTKEELVLDWKASIKEDWDDLITYEEWKKQGTP